MIRRLASFAVSFLLALPQASRAQESSTPASGEPPPSGAPTAAGLTEAARETLEFIRFVLAEEGRDAARELLRETVSGLVEAPPGEEASHLTFLLELDRVAKELASLEESRRLRESVLAIRTRLLPPDHRRR